MSILANGSTPFPLIRSALVNRVALALGSYIPTDGPYPPWIRAVASDNYEISASEPWFAVLRNYGPTPVDSRSGNYLSEQGAGRLTLSISRRMRIYLYSRAGMDVISGDEVALGGEDNTQTINSPAQFPGHDILEDLVLNALVNFVPTYTDNDNNIIPLTVGPIHWLDSEDGPAERKPENDSGLIRSHLDFGIVYIASINIGDPSTTTLPVPVQMPT